MLTVTSTLWSLAVSTRVAPASAAEPDRVPTAQLKPLTGRAGFVELAPYMAELQTLTHKLSLSIGSSNRPLARFYAYEMEANLEKIQAEVPEYDGQPIALLVDRMALPSLEKLHALLGSDMEPEEPDALRRALDGVVDACNHCHQATLHGFIRITVETGKNPFSQSFEP